MLEVLLDRAQLSEANPRGMMLPGKDAGHS